MLQENKRKMANILSPTRLLRLLSPLNMDCISPSLTCMLPAIFFSILGPNVEATPGVERIHRFPIQVPDPSVASTRNEY